MNFRYKEAYLNRYDHYPHFEKELIIAADKQIRAYYASRSAPYGLRIKKLYHHSIEKIFEARVSDKIRVLWVESEDLVVFALLGNHNEISNYIKRLK